MSRNAKIILAVIGVFALACCGIVAIVAYLTPVIAQRTLESVFSEGPTEAREIAAEIAAYDLPPGYIEQGAASLLGMRAVLIGPIAGSSETMEFLLISFPPGFAGSDEEKRAQAQALLGREQGKAPGYSAFEIVSTETVSINDKPTVFTILEGEDESGSRFRQAIGTFETESEGEAMLIAIAPVEQWDRETFVQFAGSLR